MGCVVYILSPVTRNNRVRGGSSVRPIAGVLAVSLYVADGCLLYAQPLHSFAFLRVFCSDSLIDSLIAFNRCMTKLFKVFFG